MSKSRFNPQSPEYQIEQNFLAQDSLIRAAADDVTRAEARLEACIKKRADYLRALQILCPDYKV